MHTLLKEKSPKAQIALFFAYCSKPLSIGAIGAFSFLYREFALAY